MGAGHPAEPVRAWKPDWFVAMVAVVPRPDGRPVVQEIEGLLLEVQKLELKEGCSHHYFPTQQVLLPQLHSSMMRNLYDPA